MYDLKRKAEIDLRDQSESSSFHFARI